MIGAFSFVVFIGSAIARPRYIDSDLIRPAINRQQHSPNEQFKMKGIGELEVFGEFDSWKYREVFGLRNLVTE